jgi:hypothetical protein
MDRSFTESIRHESAPESTLFALSPVVAQPDSFIVGRRLTDTNYRAWVAVYDTPCAEQLAATRMAIDRLAWRPTVGVVVFRGDHAGEAMTLESLEAQLYPAWCLT